MKLLKKQWLGFCLLASLAPSVYAEQPAYDNLTLEKIVIFSRHGLRSPIEKDEGSMAALSPYKWAEFDVPSGYLTPKGTILETYFGQYLGEWLRNEGILNEQNCTSGEGILAYANSVQRTIATGQALLAGGFAGCNVALQHKGNIGEKNPLFEFKVRSDNADFKAQAKSRLDLTALNKKLSDSYRLLSDVVDYPHSERCLKEQKCDLGGDIGKLSLETGKSAKLTGSIATAKKMVNALLLAHYYGKPANEIANSNVDSEQKWQQLNEIKNAYYHSLYKNNPELAANVALPMLQFIQNALQGKDKITLLVGHDSNIVALLGAFKIAPSPLPEQLENIPIGGKLLFEVWKDNQSNQRKFKLEYVYQTDQQIVQTTPLSLTNPPKRITLSLPDCSADQQGFCDYEMFEKVLEKGILVGQ